MKYRPVFTLAIVLFIQIGCSNSKEIPNGFFGSYFDTTGTNYWTCSIFADYLVYDNDFWSYKIKSSSENEIKLLIYKESGEKKKVKVSKPDTHYTFFDGKQEFICSKSSEAIKVKPGSGLPVMEAGIAVIKGVVFDDTSKYTQVKIVAEKYFSLRESEVRIAEVDEMGRFSISIPMLKSQSVFLHCGDHRWRRIFVTPGDSLTILVDGQSGRPVHFMGTNSDVCYHTEYVLDTFHHLGEARSRRWDLEPLNFREYMDSLASVQLNYLDTYETENQCPDLFVDWCKSFIEFNRAGDLFRYSFISLRHEMGTGNRLNISHPYYDFIESIDFNDTLMLLEANAGDLHGQISMYYGKVLREVYNSQARTHRDAYEFRLIKEQMNRKIDFFMGQEFSLMRDLMLMTVYDDMKRARMLDVLDHVYNRIDTMIQYPVFKEDLKNDYLAFLAKIESLQNIEFVANQSSESGEKLLLDIINSNRDTVVILDFWYTACGPCRTGFTKMKSIKKQLFDVPVKFVYLCYSSSEKDWASIIKEFGVKGEHYLLTGEQFAYFSNLLNISSAPRYVLIGKNGKIANDNFVQPQSYQQYMEALRKYLEN